MATDAQRLHMEVLIKGTISGIGGEDQLTYTKLHYARTPNVGTYSGASFNTALLTKFKTELLAVTSVAWNFDSIESRVLNDPTEASIITTVDEPGGVAGDCVQADVCMLIAKRTAFRGGVYRGRIFIPGVPESGADGNELAGAHKTLLDALGAKLLETVSAGGCTFTPSVLSTIKSKLKMKDNPATVFMTPINVIRVYSDLTSLDSRHSRPRS